jgi:fungal STAND N-terminal Goodbye domain
MSSNSPSSSPFQAIFNAALKEYSQKTGKDIATDPITAKLRSCSSPDAVLNVLQEEAQAFNDFRNGNRKMQLMRKLKPTVDILLALSTGEVLGNAIGSVSAQA